MPAAVTLAKKIFGSLHGRRGSFVLQHDGLMSRGARQLAITVVPDSGSGELTGLRGRMQIDIRDGAHYYHFAYLLPEP